MKNAILSVLALCAMMFSTNSSAENCSPKGDVCVGLPTGKPCGALGEVCCSANGYDYNCLSSQDTCNPTSDTCVPLIVSCSAECRGANQYYYPEFEAFGYETAAQIETLAIQSCLNVPDAVLVSYSCAY